MPLVDPVSLGLARLHAEDVERFRALLGPEVVVTDEARRAAFGSDETEALHSLPDLVLRPANRSEVAAALALAHELRLPVTPRGAGTGLSGGAIPVCGGIVLSLARLDAIRAIDPRDGVAEVEVGVTTARLQEAADAVGLFYPPDPASRESCTLGGNLAHNSAGPRSAKYGNTRRWVLGLEAVLADGRLLDTGSRCRKDSTGYDLTQLLVGSEGTLAVLTAATLRLVPKPLANLTAIAPFARLEEAAAAVERLFVERVDPSACELMESAAIDAVARIEPIPPELVGRAALLLVELDGDDREELLRRAGRLEQVALAAGGSPLLVADDRAGQARLWRVRRRVGEAVKALSSYKEADTVVPRSRLADLVHAARAAASAQGLRAILYGHAGDGNLHVNLLRGELGADEWERRRDAAEDELFRAVVSLGGRISGEHGVGWVQRRLLGSAQSEVERELRRRLKHQFDPRGILNPEKLLWR